MIFTAVLDFAYRMCLSHIHNPENYNSSSLRVVLNAAETVRSSTILRFEEWFRLENVLLPACGPVEVTVDVYSWKPWDKMKVDERGFVFMGSPFPGVEMWVMGDTGPAGPGETGEILVKSTANTIGYLKNPGATKELFDKGVILKPVTLVTWMRAGIFILCAVRKILLSRVVSTLHPVRWRSLWMFFLLFVVP